jgi:DNA repair photolyase
MSLIRQMRGGKDYDPEWGKRMTGAGPYADLIGRRFQIAMKRFGLNQVHSPLTINKFKRPSHLGEQLALL